MNDFVSLRRGRTVRGVTLIELLVAMVVFSVLAFIAVPAYQRVAEGNAIRSTTSDLITALNVARAQAVNLRSDQVAVEALDGDWGKGWILKYPGGVPEDDQSFTPRSNVHVSLTSGAVDTITFSRLGVASAEVTFEICMAREGEVGRHITLTRFGKVGNELHDCE